MTPHPAPGQTRLKRPGHADPAHRRRTARHLHPLPAPLPRAETRSKIKGKATINGTRASVNRSLTPRGPRSPPRGCFCRDLRCGAGVRSLGSNSGRSPPPPRPTAMFSFRSTSEPQAPEEGPRAGGLREGKLDGDPRRATAFAATELWGLREPRSAGVEGAGSHFWKSVWPAPGGQAGGGTRVPRGPRGSRASHRGLLTRDEPPWAHSPLFCFPAGRDLGHQLDQRPSISRWGNRGLELVTMTEGTHGQGRDQSPTSQLHFRKVASSKERRKERKNKLKELFSN